MNFGHSIKVAALGLALLVPQLADASGGAPLPEQDWGHHGAFGRFDQDALKRGAQVVTEVCMGCHSVKFIKFDQLRQIGFSEAEVAAMAEGQGKTKKDKMLTAMSDEDAQDSFNIIPPDLSLMTKARKGYEDYTYGIMTGYLTEEEIAMIEAANEDGALSDDEIKSIAGALHLDPHNPEKVKQALARIENGGNFNKYFPGNFLAMPQPLMAEAVEYPEGSPEASLHQLSHDATTFLAWAAEPTQTERKSLGVKVLIYLVIFTALMYAMKRRIWARIH